MMSAAHVAKVIVITALPVEFQAVTRHLTDLREIVHPKDTIYEMGRYGGDNGWNVAVVEVGAGNPRAAQETERAIQFFNPEVAIFVGVAGGLKDVKVGDVVASTKIYGFESGKALDEFLPRPDVHVSDYGLEQRSRYQAKKGNWLKRRTDPEEGSPQAYIGPIAAGSSVVASTESPVYKFLRKNYGDALAVEMEGHGFAKAASACHSVKAIVIRGISDLVDGKSEADASGSQERASENAAAFAFDVLETFFAAHQNREQPVLKQAEPVAEAPASRINFMLEGLYVVALASTERGRTKTVEFRLVDGEEAAAIRRLAQRPNSEVPYAHKNTGGMAKLVSLVGRTDHSGDEIWTAELECSNRSSNQDMTMDGVSPTKLAEKRAARILLDTKPDENRGLIDLVEMSVAGRLNLGGVSLDLSRSPLPAMYQSRSWDLAEYLACARLYAVCCLFVSSTVDSIYHLELKPVSEDQLEISFRGGRASYGREPEDEIVVNGILKLK